MTTRHGGLLVGLGNPWRGDDAAGPAVIQAMRRLGPDPRLELVEGVDDTFGLVELWAGVDHAVVVDAASSGAPPGTVHVARLAASLGWDPPPTLSSHGLDLSAAVGISRAVDCLPRRLTLLGIEGAAFDLGAPLSRPVAASVPRVARLALRLVEAGNGTRWHGIDR